MLLRTAAGSRLIWRVKLSSAASASLPSILQRMTKRVLRSKPTLRLRLTQRLDHRRLQPATWLRVNRSLDGLMAHMGGWIIRLHETQSLRNLLRRPVQMHELAMHEAIQIASLGKLAFAAATPAAGFIGLPRRLRAIAAVFLPTSRQLTADRARRAMQKLADQALTTAPNVFSAYHATVLAAEVLASYVHRNILCPKGSECCI
jgi:hypothetical protein